jgi:hypothetical protein
MTTQPWEPRVARLEGAYEQVDKRLESLDRNLEAFRGDAGRRFDAVDRKIDGLQWRMTSLILGSWVTLMLAMLAVFFHKT